MNIIETSTNNREMFNKRAVEYKLMKSLLKTAKDESLLNEGEYSRVLTQININYRDVRENGL
jgi:hypothetical protein